jgi:hypothetical protein
MIEETGADCDAQRSMLLQDLLRYVGRGIVREIEEVAVGHFTAASVQLHGFYIDKIAYFMQFQPKQFSVGFGHAARRWLVVMVVVPPSWYRALLR